MRTIPAWNENERKTNVVGVFCGHLTLAILSAGLVALFFPSAKEYLVGNHAQEDQTAPSNLLIDSPVMNSYSNIDFAQKQACDGIEAATECIKRNPNDSDSYVARGSFYFREKGELKKALADLTKAIKLKPNCIQAYSERAWVYNMMKRYQKAHEDSRIALKLDPGNLEASEADYLSCSHLGIASAPQ